MPFLLMAIVGAIAAAIAINANKRHKARIARARALAAQHGFHIDVGPKAPPTQQFDLFDVGRARKVSFHLWRPGEDDSVFEYKYTTGSGKNSQTFTHTCALIALPFNAAHTKIGPEGFWSGIGRAVGIRDIEVESPAFNSMYRVTSDDERFAIALLDQQMIGWLLSRQSGVGAIQFELWGPWLLCVSDELSVDLMFGYLDWAQSIRAPLPAVLNSMYPPR